MRSGTVVLPLEMLISLGLLLLLVFLALVVMKKIRSSPAQNEPPSSEMLSKFRELHEQGVLDDTEFRTIKTKLTDRMSHELKESGE